MKIRAEKIGIANGTICLCGAETVLSKSGCLLRAKIFADDALSDAVCFEVQKDSNLDNFVPRDPPY